MEKIIQQLLANVEATVEKMDIINKRLISCIIVLSVCFFLCISSMVAFYFYADYDYIDATQEVTTEESDVNQTFRTGGD